MGSSNFLGNIDWQGLVLSPLLWGILCGAIALGLLLPGRSNRIRWPGLVMAILGIGLVLYDLPMKDLGWTEVWTFRVLTIITLVSAVATVSMKSAVYAAIWFALSLLGHRYDHCLCRCHRRHLPVCHHAGPAGRTGQL